MLMPMPILDFQAVSDIRKCGGRPDLVFFNIADGSSVAYRISGDGVTGTAVLRIEGEGMLIEALSGHDRSGALTRRITPLLAKIAKAHGCAYLYCHALREATGRLYRRLANRQERQGADIVSYRGLA